MAYLADYAKSGRAGCRWCRGSIDKGTLRLAAMVQSKHHNGNDAHWYHAPCFFAKYRFLTEREINGFNDLLQEDKELIRNYLTGKMPDPKKSNPQKSGMHGVVNSGEFFVEYAKSSKSRCVSCDGKIIQGEIRLSQKDYTSERALHIPNGCMDRWHHVDCFTTNREKLEFYKGANGIPGISWLKQSDQEMLVQKLPRMEGSYFINKKTQREEAKLGKQAEATQPSELQQDLLQRQSDEAVNEQKKLISSYKASLSEHLQNSEQLSALLLHNNQDVPVGVEKAIDRLADIMAFGALERCSICKGQFVYKNGVGYHCIGYVSEFSKCTKQVTEPKRVSFTVPDDLKDNPALKYYKYVAGVRLISTVSMGVDCQEPPRKLPKIDKLPLHKFKFLISDEVEETLASELKSKLEAFGGRIACKLSKQISAIVSTPDEVKRMTKRMQYAQNSSIPVVSANFPQTVTLVDFDFAVNVKKHLLCTWICFPAPT